MFTIIWSGAASVALFLVLVALIALPCVLVYRAGRNWWSKARDRKTAINRLRMWAVL